MFAVVKTGGKQYRVAPGDIIIVERLLGDAGAKIRLDQVLMVGEDGKLPKVGTPLLGNSAVNCEIIDQSRANKVIVFKKKRRKGYKRTKGHRQNQTVLRVLDINGKGAVKPAAKKTKAESKIDTSKKIKSKVKAQAKADTSKADAAKAKRNPPKKTAAKNDK